MRINVIIPAYNEENRIPETITSFYDYFYSENAQNREVDTANLELYIVNDGSKDATEKVVREMLQQYKLAGKFMSYELNKGKGYAVRYGMLNSKSADYYYLADADLASGWETLEKFAVLAKHNPDYDAIIGSRAMPDSDIKTDSKRFLSGRTSNLIIKNVLGLKIKDTQCGYKLFNRKCLRAFELQEIERWGFDFEILYIMKLLGLKAVEVGVKWENKAGSKVKFSDYFKTLRQLVQVKTTNYKIDTK